MAEFNEVMKQIKRICKANDYKCTDCPMSTQSFCQMSAFDMEGFEAIENIVTAWAAEHPEPVYPTWGEWLEKQGIVILTNSHRYEEDGRKIYLLCDSIEKQIPADIAEKLGLKPKEG